MTYEQVKAELARRREDAKGFTRAFYKTYLSCLKKTRQNDENGVDDRYEDESGIVRWHSWDDVYNSKFYQKNGGAYCEFLNVVYGKV